MRPRRVLIDENLPTALWRLLGPHEAVTVRFMSWAGVKNGALIRLAVEEGFEVLLTGDKALPHQTRVESIAVVRLGEQRLSIIKQSLAELIAAISDARPGRVVEHPPP